MYARDCPEIFSCVFLDNRIFDRVHIATVLPMRAIGILFARHQFVEKSAFITIRT
jgi:hypothetical protein